MVYNIIIFGKKKAGMNREEFIDRYENGHAPFGAQYFHGLITSFKRYYPLSVTPAARPGASPEDVPAIAPPYDVITIYRVRDEEALVEFRKIWADPAVQRAFVEDELTLFDRDANLSGLCEVREGKGIAGA